jgi:hypothetical protein
MKIIKCLFYILIALIYISCGKNNNNDPVIDQPQEPDKDTYQYLFTDTKYQKGFKVGSTIEGNGALHGYLNYNETATGTPVWFIAQWNCINNDILNSTYTVDGSTHEYRTNGGNRVVTNTRTGSVIVDINTSSEYGLNGITSNPREPGEPWPTLLLEYTLADNKILKISDKAEVRMAIDYKVLKVEDMMPAGKTNTGLHSAQFQWFVTIQNRNSSSPDYGRYIWFGLSFYDKRYDFTPLYAAEDGGKEQNTGAFIYMPDMRNIMGAQGKTEIGKTMHVDVDILPVIKSAFTLAQQRKYLLNTAWEELYIGATNIGWEVPGTYNVAVQIDTFNIKYK